MSDCRCPKIVVGDTEINQKWNPDCPIHGQGTPWFRGEGGDQLRERVTEQIEDYHGGYDRRRRAETRKNRIANGGKR